MTFKDALTAYQTGKFSGIGVLLDGKLVGLDIDDAKEAFKEHSTLKEMMQRAVDDGHYCEKSPSRNGLRLFVMGDLMRHLGDDQKGGTKQGNLEIYQEVRFLTVTGHGKGEIKDAQWLIDEYVAQIKASKESTKPPGDSASNVVPIRPQEQATAAPSAEALEQLVDTIAKKVAETRSHLWSGDWDHKPGPFSAGIVKTYASQSDADYALCCEIIRQAHACDVGNDHLEDVADAVFRRSKLVRDKWTERDDYRTRTLNQAIKAVQQERTATQGMQEQETLLSIKRGDILNGELYARLYRTKLLFVYETGDVLAFKPDTGYVHAEPEADMKAAKEVIATLQKIAGQWVAAKQGEELDKKTKRLLAHIERSSTAPKLRAMIDVARTEDGMTRRLTELDANPMHLGLPNGIMDLQTCTLLPTTHDLLVTRRCRVAFDPDAEAPRFKAFLREVLPDKAIRKFLRVFFGHALIGRVEHQLFLFFYGLGANGKSVFIEIIRWVVGEYARKISTEMLMRGQRSPSGPSPDIMSLKGRRLVYANETEEGSRLAESRVKELTGADTLSARELYGKQVNFEPSHTLVIVGNHRPEIHDDGLGMWRRVALVDFSVTIPEAQRDPALLETLKTEGPGILNWMLDGLREYQRSGLVIPDAVKAATNMYRDEMDILGDWLSDVCTLKASETADKKKAYQSYKSWAVANGHGALSHGKLTRRLRNRGITVTADKRHYAGLKVNDHVFVS